MPRRPRPPATNEPATSALQRRSRHRTEPVDDTGDPAATAAPADPVTEEIRFAGPRGELIGVLATAPDPNGAVLVIHENRGLTEHIRSIPPRLAADGYTALAIDLLSEEGGTAVPAHRGRRHGGAGQCARRAADRRPARRPRRARTARSGREAGGDRLLLRRRDDVAAAGGRRTTAGCGRPVLRPRSGRRRLQRITERRRPGDLRRARRTGQRVAGDRPWRPRGRRSRARDPGLPRGRSRLLQRHRLPLRQRCRGQAYQAMLDWFARYLAG